MDLKTVGEFSRPTSPSTTAEGLGRALVTFIKICDVLLLPIFGILLVYLLLSTFP